MQPCTTPPTTGDGDNGRRTGMYTHELIDLVTRSDERDYFSQRLERLRNDAGRNIAWLWTTGSIRNGELARLREG